MSAPSEWTSRTVGGKYRVLRFIAQGGMGAVYEAEHSLVHRHFAIKFLRRDLTRRRDVLARFRQEAAAAGALDHENITAVVDFGVAEDGTPYIVMEHLSGCDLARLLSSSGPLPSGRAADLILQAALGVQAAHAAGVIHRDLKPQNLFVCRRSDGTDRVKLLDFGIAKLQDCEAAQTRTGALLGTPAYMSPEQARGESTLDARTDVYALGAILYELLSGRTPHPGSSANAIMHHIATEASVPLVAPEVPPALVELVHRTLSAGVADRPASAAELAALLGPFASRTAWPDLPLPEKQPDAEGESAVPPVDLHPQPRPPRSRIFRQLLLVMAALGVGALAVSWAFRSSPTPAREVAFAPATTASTTPIPAAAPSVPAPALSPVVPSIRQPTKVLARPTLPRTGPSASSREEPAATGARFDYSNPYQ